jgi:polyhydroxyalkanoate synthesis regulator phasin
MTVENMAAEEQPVERPPLAELIRKVMLAGIGAAALAQEEAEAFIQKLIEKGELAEKDGRVLMKDLREKRRQKAGEELDKRISCLIDRMNIPTKSDFEDLSEKIAEIARKVDGLKGR